MWKEDLWKHFYSTSFVKWSHKSFSYVVQHSFKDMNFIAYFQHSNYLRRVYNGTFILKAAYSLRYRVLWEYRVLGAETPESKWNPNPSRFKEHFILQVKIRTLHNFFSHLYRIVLYPENISSTAECFSLFLSFLPEKFTSTLWLFTCQQFVRLLKWYHQLLLVCMSAPTRQVHRFGFVERCCQRGVLTIRCSF